MRSSRETELAEQYPIQVVTAWIGNSIRVAEKHYLQVLDSHFDTASGGADTVQNDAGGADTVQSPRARPSKNPEESEDPEHVRAPVSLLAPRAGFEPATY